MRATTTNLLAARDRMKASCRGAQCMPMRSATEHTPPTLHDPSLTEARNSDAIQQVGRGGTNPDDDDRTVRGALLNPKGTMSKTVDIQRSFREVVKGQSVRRISIWRRQVAGMPGIAHEVRIDGVAVQHPFAEQEREAEMYRAGYVEALLSCGWRETSSDRYIDGRTAV